MIPSSMLRTLVVGAVAVAGALSRPAAAAVGDDRFLGRVDLYDAGGRSEVVIGLTGSFRYVSHSLSESGTVLQVRLVRESPAAAVADPQGFASLRAAATAAIPLADVTTQLAGAIPSVILRFHAPAQVVAVAADPDERTLTVSLGRPGAAPPRAPPPAPAGGVFVVTLRSAAAPIAGDTAAAAPGGPLRRTYQTVSRSGGVERYRLQLGFFASADEAEEFLDGLPAPLAGAWVSEITTLERDAALQGKPIVDLSTLVARPVAGAGALPPQSVDQLDGLMEEAAAAVAGNDLARAAAIYGRIAGYAIAPHQQRAQELLGVMRERGGQIALAKAAYEQYLQRYPQGDGAARVRQRLQALTSAGLRPPPRVAVREGGATGAEWDLFGSLDQFYRQDRFQLEGEPAETVRSLLDNGVDLNGRRRSASSDVRLRITGRYDHDFLEAEESEFRTSNAYLDFATRSQQHSARLGRQTRSSGGVLGRFDGLLYSYRLADGYRANLVTGAPVALSSDGLDTSRLFYGLNLDVGPLAGAWSFNAFALDQQADGLVDRRAVGADMRYFAGGNSLFGLLDYDMHFAELNIAHLIGSAALGDATTLSVIADLRKSPLLSTSNALIGQGAASLDEMRRSYSAAALTELARDRTATSTSYTASLSHALGARFRASADATVTQVDGTPASGGVDATPPVGPDGYYGLQLIGSDLLRDGDLGVFGLRYIDATAYSAVSATLNYRLDAFGRVKLNPRLRVDRRTTDAGQSRWLYGPGLRASYAPRRGVTLELEIASELETIEIEGLDTTDDSRFDFAYVGYRYEF